MSERFLVVIFLSLITSASAQDTTFIPGDSVPLFAADPANAPVAQVPSELEMIEIDASSQFTADAPHVGDTLSYIVEVTWKNPKIPVSVLAPESLSFAGFERLGVSTTHKKLAGMENGAPVVRNVSRFIYSLRAQVPGSGKARSATLPYFSAASPEREYLTVSPQLLDILPAKTPLAKRWYIQILFWAAVAVGLWFGIRRALAWRKSSAAQKPDKTADLSEEVRNIKARLQVADSKTLLLAMEKVAARYLREVQSLSADNIEGLIEAQLKKSAGLHKAEWGKLKTDFELAKFGGGNMAAHEVMETYKTLTLCINHKEDNHE